MTDSDKGLQARLRRLRKKAGAMTPGTGALGSKVHIWAIAIAALVVAVLVRWLLDPWMRDYLPLPTLYGAVALGVWVGGYCPAIVVTILGYLACNWLFIEPRGQFSFDFPRDFIGLIVYLFSCAIIIGFGEARRRAEAALRGSEECLRAFLENSATIAWLKDEEGRHVFLSRNYEARFGVRLKDWLGRTDFEVWPREIAEDFRRNDLLALQNSGPVEVVEHTVSPDGIVTWWLNNKFSFRTASGQSCVGGLGVNITERVQAEESLRRSEQRYRTLVDATSAVTWACPLSGLHVEAQPSWMAFTGQTAEEMLGAGWMKAVHPDDVTAAAARWNEAVAKGQPFNNEHRIRRHDGEWRWMSVYVVPVRDASGQFIEWFGMNLDITEQKRAQEALRESEERYHIALEGSPVVVYTCDRELRFTWVYNSLPPVTDLRLILGKRDDEILPPEAVRELVEIKRRVLASGRGERCEVCVPFDGRKYYFDYKTEPLRDATGAIIGLRGAAWDISERKRAEAEREFLLAQEQQLRAKAEEATRAKDQFISVITHELRNPLNSILGYTHLTRSHADQVEVVRRNCEIIERAVRTQSQLIDDLLDTARITTGKLKLETAPTDLLLVLNEALVTVSPAAEAKRIDLVARLGHELLPFIGDATRLQQIAWNLLQNAIKFTPEGGRVELRLERDGQHARIIVTDTGRGIEPEFLPHVFDRFSQSDMSRSRRHGGLGLGLALAKQLVELHGGTIEVASEGAGKGATFTVTLPLYAPQVFEPPPLVRAIAEVNTGAEALPLDDLPRLDGVRVLVVDDQEDARLMVAKTLSIWGAEVTMAASGEEALSLLSDRTFDVLVCDIAMPEMDGYEVLGRLRLLERQRGASRLPAIALTAIARSEDRLRALEAGFEMHVAKPVELAELILVIASLTRYRRQGASMD
ncbi:MAG: PAS domain S-box protein [Blastocatellia bacterium]